MPKATAALPIADDIAAPTQAPAPAHAVVAKGLSVRMERVDLAWWDATAAGFDGLCQEQLMAFAGVRWRTTTPEAWLFRQADRTIGGVLVIVQRLPLHLGSIAIAKWGPMLAEAKRPEAADQYAAMVEAMISEYAARRGMLLSIMAPASVAATNTEYALLMARGFHPGVLLNYPLRYIVRVGLDDAALRKGLEQKWRYQLNKSEKQGLTFEHGSAERLPEFVSLYEHMLKRKRFEDYSAHETIPHLMALEDERARPELFFVRKDDRVIAGAVVFKGGERAVYLYGATLDEALPLRAGYFLHWNIIRWLRDHSGAEWYDLGGTDGFLGLHQFKKGMVGSSGVISPVPRVANYAISPLTFAVGAGALWAREGFHEVRRRLSRLRRDRAQPTMPRHVESIKDAKF